MLGCGGRAGRRRLSRFAQKYGPRGAMITAVDLLRGIAALVGWDRIEVPGATGYLDTTTAAKGRYGRRGLGKYDLICVHVEAPDEMSHEGRVARQGSPPLNTSTGTSSARWSRRSKHKATGGC